MKIAIVASEVAPFAKTGGLADVTGALPKVLHALGHDPFVIMPLYRQVREGGHKLRKLHDFAVPIGGEKVPGAIWTAPLPGADVTVYFLECDRYFDRPTLYSYNSGDYNDNCQRFTFLSRGAIEAVRTLSFRPDIFHVHDWQTALIPVYLKVLYRDDEFTGRSASVLTIHNVAYQGNFWHMDLPATGLDWKHFNMHEFEYYGHISLLKGGVVYADVVNTVSPTYAEEIQTPEGGMGLDGTLRARSGGVRGVINGIDTSVWDPATDPYLTNKYSADDLSGKESCKRSLQRQAGLPPAKRTPLLGVVSRLVEQKGLDLLAEALPQLMKEEKLQMILLGKGDDETGEKYESIARKWPKQFSLSMRHDEEYAHAIFAGADMTVVPSRYEPCGLTQLYGLRYGTVPVVRRTGGLADTVTDCTEETLASGKATGFVFEEPTADALLQCVRRAVQAYRQPQVWRKLLSVGMKQDWSWSSSADKYVAIYAEAIAKRGK